MNRPMFGNRRPLKIGEFDLGQWFYNGWIVLDEAGNSILGGAPDETISGRLGRYKNATGWRRVVGRPLAAAVDFVFGKGHCEATAEYEAHLTGPEGHVHRPESMDDKPGD